jgi:uncharacterized spore protein YtfJ
MSSGPIRADAALPAYNILQSIMIAASPRDSTLLSGTGLSMSTIDTPMRNILGPVNAILNENRVRLSQPPSYNGSDVIGDLQSNLTSLKTTLTTMKNVTTIKQGAAISSNFPSINTINNNIDSLLTTIRTAESRRITASAATAATAQAEMNRKTASAAAAESRRITASAATAATNQAIQAAKAASAATAATAAAAEQQRISTTLSGLKTSLQGVQTAIQGGGGASGSSANPVASAVAALNSVKLSNIPREVLTNSAKATVNEAIQMLKQLKEHQKFVSTRVNAAVRAINAAATRGGSRKNNFNRSRKRGSARKRTRSRR